MFYKINKYNWSGKKNSVSNEFGETDFIPIPLEFGETDFANRHSDPSGQGIFII